MTDEVLLERPSPGVALLRLNRPEKLNALNMALRRLLAEQVQALTEDPEVRVLVITGNGKAFAAGADIAEMADATPVEMMKRPTAGYWRVLAQCPKPVIAAVNGLALGGGCEMAMHCDIILAAESAQFGQPEVRVGLLPGAGGTQRLVRAVGKYQAMRLCLTGMRIPAREALAIGLASEVVPDAELMDRALGMARELAELPPLALMQMKELIVTGIDASLEVGLALERKSFQLLFASQDQKEGARAFQEKRKPTFTGR